MRNRLLGLLATTAIVFAACQGASTTPAASSAAPTSGAPSASSAPSATPAPTPVDYDQLLYGFKYEPSTGTPGGKAIIGEWQAANQLNYYFSNAFANTEVMAATMPALLTVSADGHWMPWVSDGPITYANNVTQDAAPSTGFTVHVKILPNLKWSDGQPFTLNDMVYTWKTVLDKTQTGITTLGWEKVDKITPASDGLSADIHFKEAYAGWLGVVGANVILPEHYMKTIPIKDWSAKSYPVSAALGQSVTMGPFKYSTATADTIELVRDDNWAGPATACGGKACLDGVTYKFFGDKEGEEAAFLAGEIDVALDLQQGDYDAIKGVPADVGKALDEPAWEYEHLDMNQAGLGQGKGHPALQDPIVRKAIEQALDKKQYYLTEFPGAPDQNNNPCTNATPSNYWQLPDAKCPAFDVAAANAALDGAGYTKGADGIRVDPKSKLPLVFEHCTSSVGYRQLGADFFAKSMNAIGIKVNENFVDSTTVLFANWPDVKADTKCNLAHGNYDTSEFAYVLSFDLYGDYYYAYSSEQIPTDANKGNGYNYIRLNNPDMDAAINVLTNAIKPADQVQAAYKIQEVYLDQIPEVVIYYRNGVRGVSTPLQNFFQNPSTASDMWNIQDWWMQK